LVQQLEKKIENLSAKLNLALVEGFASLIHGAEVIANQDLGIFEFWQWFKLTHCSPEFA
jgi:hypothetical protein